jgi:hypothetical protein
MQRIRMSLPYFEEFGWNVEIVAVDPFYTDLSKDELLMETIPARVPVHYVSAFDKKWTKKIGLGSIALRSYWFYRSKVNKLLQEGTYDLIYFSTTQFPVCVLGAYWKKRFGIPYIIDMQDPWHSEYYQDKPKDQRPKKYWFSYRLNRYLESIAMNEVDGLISVSENYITQLKIRYARLKNIPSATITFGGSEYDLVIAEKHKNIFPVLFTPAFKNIVYVGRGGMDMHGAIEPVFKALKEGLKKLPELYSQLKFHFIGTSYAPTGKGVPTLLTLATQIGVADHVVEVTDRISYFHALTLLLAADALFISGSDDPSYNASKIYPYLLTCKPLLSIFHSKSPVNSILQEYGTSFLYSYDTDSNIVDHADNFLINILKADLQVQCYNPAALEKYSARHLTQVQCDFFNRLLSNWKPPVFNKQRR